MDVLDSLELKFNF
jgi:hypothetical protein